MAQMRKLRRLAAVDAIANGDDRVEVAGVDATGDLAIPLTGNDFHFGNSCHRAQLAGIRDVLRVFVDGWHAHGESSAICL